jgi:hypothetical protein
MRLKDGGFRACRTRLDPALFLVGWHAEGSAKLSFAVWAADL